MHSSKTWLIILGLPLLLGCVLVLVFRRESRVTQRARQTGDGPWFEISVEAPIFNSRPPWEIPGVIFGTRDRGPKLNQNSPGVRIGNITSHRFELSAEGGWDFLIETDSEGRLTPATHIAFPIAIGGRPNKFDCRPADPPVGYLHTKGADSGEIEGSFAVEVMRCINVRSGKTAQWPYSPLPVRGNFAGIPSPSPSPTSKVQGPRSEIEVVRGRSPRSFEKFR